MNYLPPVPESPPVLARLESLATATPPLAEPIDMIQAAVRAAGRPANGTDTRLDYALNAIEMLVKLAQYQQGRIDRLEAVERGRGEQAG